MLKQPFSFRLAWLWLVLAPFAFAQTPVQLQVDPLPEVVGSSALVITGSVNPGSASVWLNGTSVTHDGSGLFTCTLTLLP
jgi:hypothetical protein